MTKIPGSGSKYSSYVDQSHPDFRSPQFDSSKMVCSHYNSQTDLRSQQDRYICFGINKRALPRVCLVKLTFTVLYREYGGLFCLPSPDGRHPMELDLELDGGKRSMQKHSNKVISRCL